MTNKLLSRFIVVILLSAFLTCAVGRVTRVSAVGTTAAIAGTAFILTGAVYLSYIALTHGEMVLPAAEELHDWLGDVGRKVSQYPSGSEAYQDIYQTLALQRDPIAVGIDGVWTWTVDRLKSFANDFSNTDVIQNILAYSQAVDTITQVTNHYNYAFDINSIDTYYNGYAYQPVSLALSDGAVIGSPALITINNNVFVSYYYDEVYRNVLKSNGTYGIQRYTGNSWSNVGSITVGLKFPSRIVGSSFNSTHDAFFSTYVGANSVSASAYPILTQADTYVEATGEVIEAEEVVPVRTQLPSWLDPDNENRPIIPWVPIPDIPTGVPTPPGYTGPPQWGFPLQDLLDLLESLAEALMEIGVIGELINRFAGQHGDNYYLEYNDGDTNYYTYYQPTVFDNDTEYVTYNIDVSDTEEHLPVNLNTIQTYTNNRYIDSFKRSAVAGGSIIRDLVVFWYNVDPEIIYVLFGTCIVTLIAAFIGKWGHS